MITQIGIDAHDMELLITHGEASCSDSRNLQLRSPWADGRINNLTVENLNVEQWRRLRLVANNAIKAIEDEAIERNERLEKK